MIIWMFILGIVLAVASVGAMLFCYFSTPNNLRGFYGLRYGLLFALTLIGGIALIVTSCIL